MTVDTDLDARRREAASWFARLNQKRVAAADITAFSQWRRAPENAAAYARIETMWDAAETLAGDPDIAALTLGARDRADASRRAQMRLSKVLIPIGAIAGVAVTAVGVALWSGQSQSYQTGFGERRIVLLADGSKITLDADSRVRVRLSSHKRAVELTSGQAFFEVHGDKTRPFVVAAGNTAVTAVGTRFDVRRSGDGAQVTLVEGKVQVGQQAGSAPRWSLVPGQQVLTTVERPVVRRVNAEAETSWTSGRLIFEGDTVESAAAEVSRYSHEKIVIAAPAIGRTPVSGAFNTGDVESFLSALTDLYPVIVDRGQAGKIVIRDAPEKIRTVP
jgi:transmembrane sensor